MTGITKTRILGPLAALLLVGLLVAGMTSSAVAGEGGGTATAAKKKKKKKCPAGTVKQVLKKKGKKKIKCVAIPTTPAPTGAPALLAITPGSQDFGTVQHGGFPGCTPPPDADCPTRDFVVTNTGGSPSGVPAISYAVVADPQIPDGPAAAFATFANTCTAALAPGASCSVTVRFAPSSNAGDKHWISTMNVVGSPGGTAQATLTGDSL